MCLHLSQLWGARSCLSRRYLMSFCIKCSYFRTGRHTVQQVMYGIGQCDMTTLCAAAVQCIMNDIPSSCAATDWMVFIWKHCPIREDLQQRLDPNSNFRQWPTQQGLGKKTPHFAFTCTSLMLHFIVHLSFAICLCIPLHFILYVQ